VADLIQWPRAQYWDKPWNPIVGCRPCSPACDNCYARTATVDRFGQSFDPHKTKKVSPPSSGVVFAGNMTDLFGEWRTCGDMARDINIALTQRSVTFLWCTKRPRRMNAAVRYVAVDEKMGALLGNHYFGFTAENQEWYDARCLDMALTNAAQGVNYWLSAEPLLGPIDLNRGVRGIPPFNWVAVGCESGPKRRPCRIEWIESIVYQCRSANVPVFVKQLDLNGKCERDITKFPKHLQIRQVPWSAEVARA